jgi:hypothetical protein
VWRRRSTAGPSCLSSSVGNPRGCRSRAPRCCQAPSHEPPGLAGSGDGTRSPETGARAQANQDRPSSGVERRRGPGGGGRVDDRGLARHRLGVHRFVGEEQGLVAGLVRRPGVADPPGPVTGLVLGLAPAQPVGLAEALEPVVEPGELGVSDVARPVPSVDVAGGDLVAPVPGQVGRPRTGGLARVRGGWQPPSGLAAGPVGASSPPRHPARARLTSSRATTFPGLPGSTGMEALETGTSLVDRTSDSGRRRYLQRRHACSRRRCPSRRP